MNALKSQKDVFDWDLNAIEEYNKEKNKSKKVSYGKQMTAKNLYNSKLFTGEEEKKPEMKKIYKGESDIFNRTRCETAPTEKTIHRRNRNAESEIGVNTVMERQPRKLNLQQQSSKENPLLLK